MSESPGMMTLRAEILVLLDEPEIAGDEVRAYLNPALPIWSCHIDKIKIVLIKYLIEHGNTFGQTFMIQISPNNAGQIY